MDRDDQLEIARQIAPIASKYGFAISGGQALALHGYAVRPTEDLDLFTNVGQMDISAVVAEVVMMFTKREVKVDVDEDVTGTHFGRILVHTAAGVMKVEFAHDYRDREPIETEWGFVIHPIDSATSKMSAFWARREPRDSIDVYSLVHSGDFSKAGLFTMLADFDGGFETENFIPSLDAVATYSDSDFARYRVSSEEAATIRAFFADWARSLRG